MDKNPRFPKGKSKKVKIFITKFWETDGIIVATGVEHKDINKIMTDKFINYEIMFVIGIDCELTIMRAFKAIEKKRKNLIISLKERLLKLEDKESFFKIRK